MCKSKYQVLYTYLLAAFVALIAVANHFNFQSKSTADAFLTNTPVTSTVSEIESVEKSSTPIISNNFRSSTPVYTSNTTTTTKTTSVAKSTPVVKLPAAERVNTTSVDAGSGVKIYNKMLYAHSTKAGNAFKSLSIGSLFEATIDGETATYRVVSRNVYSLDYFNNSRSIRFSVYNYNAGISLMTCGNGSNNDENYRLVLLAVKN